MTHKSRPLPVGEAKATAVRKMFDAIAPRYDLVNRIMTFGLDMRWRRKAVTALDLQPGSLIVDVACGTGDFCRELEGARYRAVGVDLSMGMLARARTDAPLLQADGLRAPFRDGTFDGATCGFALRNVIDIATLIAEFARLLRPGGRVSVLEVAEPQWILARAGHRLYFRRVVPLIGGLLSDRDAYRYLPESAVYLPPRADLVELFEKGGFTDASSRLVGWGAAQIITGTRE